MNSYLETLNLNLAHDSAIAQLRHEVLSAIPWEPTPTTNVSYVAANRLLIIAGQTLTQELRANLPDKILSYVAIPSDKSSVVLNADTYNCAGLVVSGYLGKFEVTIEGASSEGQKNNLAKLFEIETGLFDQVIDCSDQALISAAIKPPGYHYYDPSAKEYPVLDLVPDLIGEFEKPRYFDYNPNICAHGRSGIPGCTRCLDACPTEAIISIGEAIEVNPHLCQGGGVCASSCPTGAINYVYPAAEEQIECLRVILKKLRERNQKRGITLLIFDNEHGRDHVMSCSTQLADDVIPYVVEEIGSVGLDILSAALAYGANKVLLYVPENISGQVVSTVTENCSLIQSVLEQTLCRTHSVQIVHSLEPFYHGQNDVTIENAATFSPVGGKRSTIRAALTFFSELSANQSSVVSLPDSALFGQIHVNQEACTLCMGCVSVCPAGALQAGGDTPALRFIEANCVQCGICSQACPESAVTLEPRLHFDLNVVNQARTQKEEVPFHCLDCGKPFATMAMIGRMTEKLKNHWMYAKPDAMRRLKLCEDCRVKDMFDKNDMIS